jgi:hypothetical protein
MIRFNRVSANLLGCAFMLEQSHNEAANTAFESEI